MVLLQPTDEEKKAKQTMGADHAQYSQATELADSGVAGSQNRPQRKSYPGDWRWHGICSRIGE
jgi:hypothetical protein